MPDFSHIIPESHLNVSPGSLETLIQAQSEESFTGLMRLNNSAGENLIFSFLEGRRQRLYRCREAVVEIVPRQIWQEAFTWDNASVGLLPLPVEAMRFARVAHEGPIRQVETSILPSEQLTDAAGNWAVAPAPGVVHVQGDNVNRYYLIAGDSTPVIEELSVLGGEARFSLNDASFPKMLPKLDYHVVRYVSDHDHDVWREYKLRLAFNPLMRMLLNRFSELAGRVLTERLCEQISVWAREGGWNVSLSSNGIVNRQYFESLESAIEFYVDLIRCFNNEASPALGPRMMDSISREALMKLDANRRELLTRSIFGWFGGSSGTRGAWR